MLGYYPSAYDAKIAEYGVSIVEERSNPLRPVSRSN